MWAATAATLCPFSPSFSTFSDDYQLVHRNTCLPANQFQVRPRSWFKVRGDFESLYWKRTNRNKNCTNSSLSLCLFLWPHLVDGITISAARPPADSLHRSRCEPRPGIDRLSGWHTCCAFSARFLLGRATPCKARARG